MEIRVSPTRMQLQQLKKRHAMAVRGHKLLKDKLDELMKHFLELVRRDRDLREQIDDRLGEAFRGFLIARGAMSAAAVDAALMYPKETISLRAGQRHIMNVAVPPALTGRLSTRATPLTYTPTALPTPRLSLTQPSGCCRRQCPA